METQITKIDDIESSIMKDTMPPGSVVFQVGTEHLWTQKVLSVQPRTRVFAFAKKSVFSHYREALQEYIIEEKVVATELILGRKSNKELSLVCIDDFCAAQELFHISFLKIDKVENEKEVLLGAWKMLRRGLIDFIHLADRTEADKSSCKDLYNYLDDHRYTIFAVQGTQLVRLSSESASRPQMNRPLIAVHQRLVNLIVGRRVDMIDIKTYCDRYGFPVKGIIHIGAHEGEEIEAYEKMGATEMVLVEANPEVYDRLVKIVAGKKKITTVNCAISDNDGNVSFRVTSMDQSSSLLPLKDHKMFYPGIDETNVIEVPARTLDTLEKELELNREDFNILALDIQGAELMALRGSVEMLKHIDVIYTEVSHYELYEGSAQVHQLDDFLELHGFSRIVTHSPYAPSWADALYIKSKPVSMRQLGRDISFENKLFMYSFVKTYSHTCNCILESPDWEGVALFDLADNPISANYPIEKQQGATFDSEPLLTAPSPKTNIDIEGDFLWSTHYYTRWKWLLWNFFTPKSAVSSSIDLNMSRLWGDNATIIAMHLVYNEDNMLKVACKSWLERIWSTLQNPVLYIVTDNNAKAIEQFASYKPFTSNNFDTGLGDNKFFLDFYLLKQSAICIVAENLFSFAASMLNEKAKIFLRQRANDLEQFDPWASNPPVQASTTNNKVPGEENELTESSNEEDIFKAIKAVRSIAESSVQSSQISNRRLHIGGTQKSPGWEIFNIMNAPDVDHVGNAKDLHMFPDNTFSAVYASHVLEHFDYINGDIINTLKEWKRVLVPNGSLYISVPDLEILANLFVKKDVYSVDERFFIMRMMFGGHINDYDYHFIGLNQDFLKAFFVEAGFGDIQRVSEFGFFNDTSALQFKGTFISCNMIAKKPK